MLPLAVSSFPSDRNRPKRDDLECPASRGNDNVVVDVGSGKTALPGPRERFQSQIRQRSEFRSDRRTGKREHDAAAPARSERLVLAVDLTIVQNAIAIDGDAFAVQDEDAGDRVHAGDSVALNGVVAQDKMFHVGERHAAEADRIPKSGRQVADFQAHAPAYSVIRDQKTHDGDEVGRGFHVEETGHGNAARPHFLDEVIDNSHVEQRRAGFDFHGRFAVGAALRRNRDDLNAAFFIDHDRETDAVLIR